MSLTQSVGEIILNSPVEESLMIKLPLLAPAQQEKADLAGNSRKISVSELYNTYFLSRELYLSSVFLNFILAN
jgi:hypothetical protein